MRSQIESGAELLARLNSKPSLYRLDDTLFVEGPRNTDIIEIDGERSTGKTLLLSQMLAKCILPDYYGAVQIRGCNASAILINTDHHFQVSKLIEVMTDIVDAAYTLVPFTSETIKTDSDKIDVIRNSLRNLYVIDCYDSQQFFLTLRTLDDVFLGNVEIALLAIDSITAYYWQDRENNATTPIDSYIRKLLKLIRVHTARFNVATIYTRPRESIDCKEKKFAVDLLADTIEYYKIHLRRTHSSQKFICTLEAGQTFRKIHYSISSNGIQWEAVEGEG